MLYANPPWICIEEVLTKVEKEKLEMIIVLPKMRNKDWWRKAEELEIERLELGKDIKIFEGQQTEKGHTEAEFSTVAMRISGKHRIAKGEEEKEDRLKIKEKTTTTTEEKKKSVSWKNTTTVTAMAKPQLETGDNREQEVY